MPEDVIATYVIFLFNKCVFIEIIVCWFLLGFTITILLIIKKKTRKRVKKKGWFEAFTDV